jgi:hypothetical protein
LLDTGLSNGKSEKTVEGFDSNGTLTRAEAVTFILNLKSKLDMLYPSPIIEQKYDPATANLRPAESMVLDIRKPGDDGMIKFSDVTFDSILAGYNRISSPNYTISGKALNGLGDNLTIKVGRKEADGFVEFQKNYVPIREDGKFELELKFPDKGLYLITVEAPADFHHRVGMMKICMFYVDYR